MSKIHELYYAFSPLFTQQNTQQFRYYNAEGSIRKHEAGGYGTSDFEDHSCVALVESDPTVDWNPAVRALLGYAYRLARVQHGVTQRQVCEQYGLTPQQMTALKHGQCEAHSQRGFLRYLRTLFTANSPRELQALQLLM